MIRRRSGLDNRRTYTKKAVRALLIIGVISAEIPFVLAAFDKAPVEPLGIAWITEVVAVILGYMCKAYFETKQERKQNLQDFLAENSDENLDSGINYNNDCDLGSIKDSF